MKRIGLYRIDLNVRLCLVFSLGVKCLLKGILIVILYNCERDYNIRIWLILSVFLKCFCLNLFFVVRVYGFNGFFNWLFVNMNWFFLGGVVCSKCGIIFD